MKNIVLALSFSACCTSLFGQFYASKAYEKISLESTQVFENLKAKLIEIEDFQNTSLSNDYQNKAVVFDSLALVLENQLKQLRLSTINRYMHDLFEKQNNKGLLPDDLELTIYAEEKELSKAIDLLKKISASFRFYDKTQSKFALLPIKNKYDAYIYDQSRGKATKGKFLNQTKISLSPEDMQYSLFSEVFSDYFSFVKFSLGSVVTFGQSKEVDNLEYKESQDSLYETPTSTTINKLVSGGGNLVFNVSYPLCVYINERSNLRYSTSFQNRLAMDVPLSNTSLNGIPINVEPSLISSFYISGMNEVLALTLDIKLARVFGNARFYNLLGRETNGSFFLNQFSIGIQVNKKSNLGINFYLGDSFVKQNFPSTLSLGLLF